MNDEIIDEVRAIKESLAEAVGFDVRRIFEDIKRSEAQTELEGWHHVQPIDVLPEKDRINRINRMKVVARMEPLAA